MVKGRVIRRPEGQENKVDMHVHTHVYNDKNLVLLCSL